METELHTLVEVTKTYFSGLRETYFLTEAQLGYELHSPENGVTVKSIRVDRRGTPYATRDVSGGGFAAEWSMLGGQDPAGRVLW